MKRILNYQHFLYFRFLLSLCFLFGCGEAADEEGTLSIDHILEGEFQWPSGTTGELWELTDIDIAELMAITPPPDWYKTEDPELYNKYYFAQLLKQFGDMPELRYIIAFLRKPGKNITREQAIAYSEAQYRLFPNEKNLDALLEISSFPTKPQISPYRDGHQWMKEDPEGYMVVAERELLRRYGDIPEVHTYVRLELKRLLGKKLTDAERAERNAAALHLKNLDEQREDNDN